LERDYNNQKSDEKALEADLKAGEQYEQLLTSRISTLRRQIRESYLRMSHINSETHKLNEKWSQEKQKVEGAFN